MTATSTLALLNTTIATSDGFYRLRTLSLDEARTLVKDRIYEVESGQQWNFPAVTSYVGHESTAAVLETLLGVKVEVNREPFAQAEGQAALCLKLRGRPPEGRILTVEEIEQVGYEFKLLERSESGQVIW
jgi:hypothetical protein